MEGPPSSDAAASFVQSGHVHGWPFDGPYDFNTVTYTAGRQPSKFYTVMDGQ